MSDKEIPKKPDRPVPPKPPKLRVERGIKPINPKDKNK